MHSIFYMEKILFLGKMLTPVIFFFWWIRDIFSYSIQYSKLKDFISCRTEGVVYMLQCPCTLQYIGRTKRPMWKRIQEHIQNIRNVFLKHSVSRHFLQCHNKNPVGLKFWAIDKYKPHWRGSHRVRELSKCESRWTFEVGTLLPMGFNIDFDFNCFIFDF